MADRTGLRLFDHHAGRSGASASAAARAVALVGELALVATRGGDLVTVDVSDPTRPAERGRVAVGGEPADLVAAGTTAFVALGPRLAVVDFADAGAPRLLPGDPLPIAGHLALRRAFLYTGAVDAAAVLDVSDPARPRAVGPATQRWVAPRRQLVLAAGHLVVFAEQSSNVYVASLHDPRQTVLVQREVSGLLANPMFDPATDRRRVLFAGNGGVTILAAP